MMFALLALPLALAQPSPAQRQIQQALEQIADDNRDIRELARAPRSRTVIEQIERKSRAIDQRLDEIAALTARLGAHRPPPGPPPGPPPPVGPVPADPADFAMALAAVKGETFPDQRLQRLKDVARDRYFLVDQVLQLLDAFDFADRKVEAAVALHPRTVDPQDWYRVYDTFTFDSHKDELRKRLGQ